jgi:hypothetical protein
MQNIFSQDLDYKKNEFELNYAFLTDEFVLNVFSEAIIHLGKHTNSNYVYRDSQISLGAIYFTYRYNLMPSMSIGLTSGLDLTDGYITDYNGRRIGTTKKVFLTCAAECKYKYLEKKIITLYGYLGIGYSILLDRNYFTTVDPGLPFGDKIQNHFNMHITPIGMRLGKKFGGFLEIGLGYKGLINAGVSLNL